MSRTPTTEVTRLLRAEVGFGCPIPGCGNPYLEWHHFDPPYAEEAHHRPEGMIALCAEHHKKADAGAYTLQQLRSFKRNRANADAVRGRLDWMRNELLAVVGGNFYYETLNVVRLDGQDIVFFRRDEDGYLRLNLRLPSLSPVPRAMIDDNFWGNIGEPTDLRSPPSGRLLDIRYETGDWLAVEFLELSSAEMAHERYQSEALDKYGEIRFPITAVEINLTIAGTSISLTPHGTKLPGGNSSRSGLTARCGVGLVLRYGLPWRQNTSASVIPKFARNIPCPCGSQLRYKHCHGYVHDA